MNQFDSPKSFFRFGIFMLFSVSWFGAAAQTKKIGSVTDKAGNAIPNATIILESAKDSSLINTIFPDTSGNFEWTPGNTFPILMYVSSLGYWDQYILLADSSQIAKTKKIILVQDQKQLGEIVIKSVKPLIERKIDRTVFNVSQSITASGGDAMDAIKKAPNVLVKNDEISLVGKSGVKVMVNDRLIQLSGDDLASYLRSIPAGNIERIEVITAPPAKYDAEGNSGLINIVLKKNKGNGLNGNVSVALRKSKGQTAYGGINLNYRKDKFNVYLSAGYQDGFSRPVEERTTQFPNQFFSTKDPRKDNRQWYTINTGFDYNIHKNAILGAQFNHVTSWPDVWDTSRTNIYNLSNLLDSTSQTNAFNKRLYTTSAINLNYDWKIDSSGKKISINLNRFWNETTQQRDYQTQAFYQNNAPTDHSETNKSTGKQNIVITTAQLDIEHPTKWMNLSYGGKLSFTENNSNNVFETVKGMNYMIDPTKSNIFKYKENVQALYINSKKEIGKWSFQLGFRGEFTQTTGNSVTLSQVNINNYFKLFPTAYVMYTFNEDNVLNLNYSKRISRPDYDYFNPFRWYSSPFDYSVGNPYLKPSYNNNFELNYRFKKDYSLALMYQRQNSIIDQATILDTIHNTEYSIRDNIGTSNSIGLDFNASISLKKWWQAQFELTGFYYSFNSDYYNQSYGARTYKSFGGYLESKNSFTLNSKKTLFAECNAAFSPATRDGFDQIKPYGGIDIGFKVLLMQKNLTINITANDILATERTKGYSAISSFSWNNYYDIRYIRLTVMYKFGNQHVKDKRERATGIETESGRAN